MTGGPRTTGRAGLSLERIAGAALELLDREGMGALTMRRVAEELGVGTMTLYTYVRNKHELLDAVVAAAVGEPEQLPAESTWREQLRALALHARDMLGRHPALVAVRVQQPVLQPPALRITELAIRALRDAGFPAEEAARALRLLFTYTFGFAAFSPSGREAEAERAALAAFAALPPADYPAVTQTAGELARSMGGDDVFAYGLDRILDGLKARLDELDADGRMA